MLLSQSKECTADFICTYLTLSEPPLPLCPNGFGANFNWKLFFQNGKHTLWPLPVPRLWLCYTLPIGWTASWCALRIFSEALWKPLNFSWALSCYTSADGGPTLQLTVWISRLLSPASLFGRQHLSLLEINWIGICISYAYEGLGGPGSTLNTHFFWLEFSALMHIKTPSLSIKT